MSQGEVLIKAENVSKKFSRNLRRSLWYGVTDIIQGMLGMTPSLGLRKDEFWAVNNVSFEVRRGECLGLIGHNGAGKSTLLKMLNGLIRPDEGRIEMHGRVGALIELGAGFNPLLTGRENVYVNGTVLGFTRQEIDRKFDTIVAFAELGEFIDMPVQNYSSGMKVRLGFAVASQMEPDILIIDEVLAVGDMGFTLKCLNRIDEILGKTAVIFVSHSMPQVYRIASQILLLDSGKSVYSGDNVSEGLDNYYAKFNFIPSFSDDEDVKLISLAINNIEVQKTQAPIIVNRLNDLRFDISIELDPGYKNPEISLAIYDKEQRAIAQVIREKGGPLVNNGGLVEVSIILKDIQLSKGIYSLTLIVNDRHKGRVLLRAQSCAFFQVSALDQIWTPFQLTGEYQQKSNQTLI